MKLRCFFLITIVGFISAMPSFSFHEVYAFKTDGSIVEKPYLSEEQKAELERIKNCTFMSNKEKIEAAHSQGLVYFRAKGGGAIGPDLEAMEKKDPYIEYYTSGRAWLKVVSGVNYSGYCKNNNCPAKGYVYIPVGKVEFLIRNGEYCYPSKCPQCKNGVEIRDWGFSHCCFQIIWRKSNGRGIRDWCRADKQYYKLSMDDLGKAEYQEVKLKFLPPDADLSLQEDNL